eukprot:TRINITY_DN8224_c0_g1_i1.p1 TRINITY_DN8224_c0_g1~~TRINITY_DN8224_c0_g1_i1.p1  ORF type:complete len:309 (+),score=74.77 TRINITY_DN8224_c0_g1_i1:37-963(+)
MSTQKKTPSWLEGSKDIISGIVGGVALVIAGHPLDTIKVRLQTMPKPLPGQPPLFTGTWDCAVKTVRNEGARGLFKGMMSPITGVPPIYAIVFGAYGSSKRALARSPDDPLSLTRIFIAGCITGVATTIITAPVELVKARLQVQYNAAPVPGVPTFNGPMEMAKHIVKTEGVPGLFRGTVATLWRDVPGSGIYFAVYEAVRRTFAKQAGVKPTEIGALKTLIAGGCAGMGIWICMFPVDLLKSRAQTDSTGAFKPGTRGLIAAGAAIYKEAGVAGLYKGLVPCLIRSFPANAACFLAVELTMRFLNRF